ncbi:MAG: arylamine N-acetyltransferase [Eubacteriales bacterium]|nr:arylamine N-acetyltransferase [Eubacteriales bacterium]
MYESMYAPVPDVDAYLERIHCKRPKALIKESLDELVFSHQCCVPFENLDVWMFKKEISLDIHTIFEKVVTNRRGGYCFELNALFTALLNGLGFHAYSCMCRITRNKDYVPLVLHRGIIAEIEDRKYFCDVGYGGPMPPASILVEDGAELHARGEDYYMYRSDSSWWTIKRKKSSGDMESMLQFYTMPQEPVNYIPMNEYCSRSEKSVFCQKLYVNRRTEDGNVSIMGNCFVQVKEGQVLQDREFGEEELPGLLKEYFGIEV